ncbi:unnamed protein product [Plutella xylostella]|uniref:(diamondback moth) hypothetical protein n=1 Tax=Plutella xylostella TaxID=51655 RepID=A0A8S4ETW2_PLUXY|nr:unnamed protein product [Plutella xylostella]
MIIVRECVVGSVGQKSTDKPHLVPSACRLPRARLDRIKFGGQQNCSTAMDIPEGFS